METTLAPEIDLLLGQLNSPNAGDRRMAAARLGKLDCRDERVRSALEFVAINDLDSFAQSEAIYALEDLGFPIPKQAGPPEIDELPLTETEARIEGKKFGIRAGAYIIDAIFLNITNYGLLFTIAFIVGIVLRLNGQEAQYYQRSNTYQDIILSLIVIIINYTIFEWLFGATPGKLILRMRVVKESGEPCDFKAALIRAVLRPVDGLFFAIPAYASMKFPLYQRIGDKAAKTIVVSTKSEVIQRPRQWWWFFVAGGVCFTLNIMVAIYRVVRMIDILPWYA